MDCRPRISSSGGGVDGTSGGQIVGGINPRQPNGHCRISSQYGERIGDFVSSSYEHHSHPTIPEQET